MDSTAQNQVETSYKALMAKASALLEQAERVRKEERAHTILIILEQMKAHDISVKELAPARRQFKRTKGEAIYRDEATGKTWTGMGRMPGWLKQKVQDGASIESFKIRN